MVLMIQTNHMSGALPVSGGKMQIQKVEFGNQSGYEIQTSKIKMGIVTSLGPRIASFGKIKGRNLLFWDGPKPKLHREEWYLRGGHRVWTTRPGADENEETYSADNLPCSVKTTKKAIQVSAPVDPVHGTQKSLTIQVEKEHVFSVENRVTNTSPMLWSGGVWGLTCTAPQSKCFYGIPVGDGSEWDMFRSVCFKKWGGGQTSRFNDPQVGFTENCMTITPKGVMAKRMVESHAGIVGMTDPKEKVSFIKYSGYIPEANYPMGTNTAFYIALKNKFVEMELMSPMVTLKPGESIALKEYWILTQPVDWKSNRLDIKNLTKW